MKLLKFVTFQDSNCTELISSVEGNCLVKCLSPDCYERYCCDLIDPEELRSIFIAHTQVRINK